MLTNKKVILGITGSIASIKCIDLIKKLLAKKVLLQIILTEAAEHFIPIDSLKQALGTDEVFRASDLFSPVDEMLHIKLAKFPDIILITPASANFIAKLANGFADDLLSSVCLASSSTIAVAPAMNQQMWHNSFTQSNIDKLRQHNIQIIGPAEGLQACGDMGYGRMVEPDQIVLDLERFLSESSILAGKKVVITAGATIEKIDPVRYISNFSSGKMGYELAKAAQKAGAEVILVSGKTNLPVPFGVKVEYITSAADMLKKSMQYCKQADIFISAAAVADYTPVVTHEHKLKKHSQNLQIQLKPTADIVRTVANLDNRPFIVCFAAETDDLLIHAQRKLIDKNLDMIIANDVSGGEVFGSDNNQVYIFSKHSSEPIFIEQRSKEEIAKIIINKLPKS